MWNPTPLMEADGINRSMKYKERSMMMMAETSKPKRPNTTACKPKRLKTTVCEPKRLKTTAEKPEWPKTTVEKPERPKTTSEDSVEEESITVAKRLSKVVIQSFRYTWNWKPIVKDKLPPLSQLLSASANNTPTQSLLLNKAGQKVAFEDTLKHKFVLVYFWCLPPREEGPPYNLDYIKNEVSKVEGVHDYRPFAFVLVALGNEKLFEQMFSRMPSYAIALKEDEKARKFLMETLGFEDNESGSRGLFFDENGLLVSDDATINMSAYGPFAFPFSKSRISSFMQECKELRKQIFLAKQIPPLSKLIVPTYEIESTKIVGLYFFAPNINGLVHTQKLLSVWNLLKPDDRDNFAVVVVNQHPCHLSSAMKCFRNDFGDQVPWYQVQISGEKPCLIFGQGGMYDYCRKTREEGKLIILKCDRYQPVSYFALNILVKYGAGAYPFTMEAAMESSKKQKNIPVLSEELMCQYHWDFERLLKTVDDDIPFTADSDLQSD
ncbi:hypothetical protein OROGR_005235 [Orobanche gracilis]